MIKHFFRNESSYQNHMNKTKPCLDLDAYTHRVKSSGQSKSGEMSPLGMQFLFSLSLFLRSTNPFFTHKPRLASTMIGRTAWWARVVWEGAM